MLGFDLKSLAYFRNAPIRFAPSTRRYCSRSWGSNTMPSSGMPLFCSAKLCSFTSLLILFADSSTIRSSSVSRPLRCRATSAKPLLNVADGAQSTIMQDGRKITSVEIKRAVRSVREQTGELKKKREIHTDQRQTFDFPWRIQPIHTYHHVENQPAAPPGFGRAVVCDRCPTLIVVKLRPHWMSTSRVRILLHAFCPRRRHMHSYFAMYGFAYVYN